MALFSRLLPTSSFRNKLFAAMALLMIPLAIALTIFLSLQKHKTLQNETVSKGQIIATMLAEAVRLDLFAANRQHLLEQARQMLKVPDVSSVTIQDAKGEVLAHVARNLPAIESQPLDLQQRTGKSSLHATTALQHVRHEDTIEFSAPVMINPPAASAGELVLPETISGNAPTQAGVVRIILDSPDMHSSLLRTIPSATLAGVIFLLGSLLVAYTISRSVMGPVEHLYQGVKALENGNTDVQVPVASADEIGALAAAFNRMVGQLRQQTAAKEASEAQVLELNADLEEKIKQRTVSLEATNRELELFNYAASHDLRGPLARQKGYCEVLRDDFGAQLGSEGLNYLEKVFSL
jgi:HAMP domain-containing protein